MSQPSFSNVLGQIQKSKTIRIGTTFDYPPFSYKNTIGEKKGIDIELALALAKSLGVEAIFIETTWKTLTQDLQANRFDIALSGVSRTNKRLKEGIQGIGYIKNGKLPISKCSKAHLYPNITSINNAKVRAITNPGGTNEAFAKEFLGKTKLITHKNNTTIFHEIINGRADIMITDSVEVRFQVKKHKGILCSTMKSNLTSGVITYFAQSSKELKSFLDKWFLKIKTNGLKKKIIEKYL